MFFTSLYGDSVYSAGSVDYSDVLLRPTSDLVLLVFYLISNIPKDLLTAAIVTKIKCY